MKEEDIRLFNGDDILKWLQENKIFNYATIDDPTMFDDSNVYNWNWWKDNVESLKNVGVSNISCVLKEDGTGRFHCDLTADVIAKKMLDKNIVDEARSSKFAWVDEDNKIHCD
jgi:hypothetical protein